MRYIDRKIIENSSETYEEVLEEKGVSVIKHFNTPRLQHLTSRQISQLERVTHVWKTGDRYYKLAYEHYGDSKYWWVIAWWNSFPTEASISLGTPLRIPLNLEQALIVLEV